MQLSSEVQIPDGLLAANALLSENSRLGVPTSTQALHPGFGFVISSTAMDFQFRCSEIVSGTVVAPNNAPTQNPWKKFGNALKSCAPGSAPSAAAGAGAVAAGTNALSTAGKFAGMTAGTSIASQFFRAVLPQSIGATWAPTLMNPMATSGVLGGVVGRWVPIIGEAKDGHWLQSFAIVTTVANELMTIVKWN